MPKIRGRKLILSNKDKDHQRNMVDTRLDWRDPAMPVLGKSGRPIPHEKMVLKAQMALELSPEPKWNQDPTYHMKRKPNGR